MDGELTAGGPNKINFDSPGVNGNRRATTSTIWANYGASRVTRKPANFGGAALAAGRPLLAEKRGDARYVLTSMTSAISVNYRAPRVTREPAENSP